MGVKNWSKRRTKLAWVILGSLTISLLTFIFVLWYNYMSHLGPWIPSWAETLMFEIEKVALLLGISAYICLGSGTIWIAMKLFRRIVPKKIVALPKPVELSIEVEQKYKPMEAVKATSIKKFLGASILGFLMILILGIVAVAIGLDNMVDQYGVIDTYGLWAGVNIFRIRMHPVGLIGWAQVQHVARFIEDMYQQLPQFVYFLILLVGSSVSGYIAGEDKIKAKGAFVGLLTFGFLAIFIFLLWGGEVGRTNVYTLLSVLFCVVGGFIGEVIKSCMK